MKLYFTPFLFAVLLTTSCDNKRQATEEGIRDFEQSKEALALKLEESLDSEDGGGLDTNVIQEHKDAVVAAADKMGGKLGQAIKAVSALDSDVMKIVEKLNEEALKFESMLNWQTLKEKNDYEDRRKYFVKYKALNQEIIDDYAVRPMKVKKALDIVKLTGKERRGFESGYFKTLKQQTMFINEIRNCDIGISDSATRVLNLLEKSGDAWDWDVAQGAPNFEKDEDLSAFNQEMDLFVELGNQQLEAQKKLVEFMTN